MGISKIDILGKKFSRCLRGYCPDEVDLVMHDAAEALGASADENRRLAERIADLEHAFSLRPQETAIPQPSDELSGTLATGRKIVEDIQDNARREAQRILEDARLEAVRVKEDANLAKARIFEEIADLKAQRDAFWHELRGVLESHFRLLESQQNAPPGRAGGEFTFAEGQE